MNEGKGSFLLVGGEDGIVKKYITEEKLEQYWRACLLKEGKK